MLGERIKLLRKIKNISQVELAHKLGVSKQSVSNWENNNIQPSVDMLIKLADYFSCTTDYLLELDDFKSAVELDTLSPMQVNLVRGLIEEFEKTNLANHDET